VSSNAIVIGVDPGLDGALAAINGDSLVMTPMPVFAAGGKRYIDEPRVVNWLIDHAVRNARVFIESVHAMPGQGVVSMFTFGCGWGQVRGICAGLGIPYELVRPQEWQKEMLAGQPRGSEYLVASRLWPMTDWRATPKCKTVHDGLVDAVLIAEFGRRKMKS